MVSFDVAYPYHTSQDNPFDPSDCFEGNDRTNWSSNNSFNIPTDQDINTQQSIPVPAFDTMSNQQEINNDMKFLSHSDFIDLNLNELNILLTANDENDEPNAREYYLEAYDFDSPDFEVLLTKQQKEEQDKSIDYDVMPIMSSTIKSPEKNYLLIPVNKDIEKCSMLQNCKSIDLNTEVLNKIDSASAGRSGVLLPLQMNSSTDSVSPNITRKTPIRVVQSLTTNKIITSTNKPETVTSTGVDRTTNITVHQTINIYEEAEESTIMNPPSRTRKRKQTFGSVKRSDESEFKSNVDPPAVKKPIKEDPDPLIPTTSELSQQQAITKDEAPITKLTSKKVLWNKKKTEKCPKCNQIFKKLSIHALKCKFDSSLFQLKDDTKKELK